jgi:hypothetical protein
MIRPLFVVPGASEYTVSITFEPELTSAMMPPERSASGVNKEPISQINICASAPLVSPDLLVNILVSPALYSTPPVGISQTVPVMPGCWDNSEKNEKNTSRNRIIFFM